MEGREVERFQKKEKIAAHIYGYGGCMAREDNLTNNGRPYAFS